MLVVLWSIFTERKEKKHKHTRWWIYCGLFSLKEKSHINMFGIILLKIEAGNDNVNEAV
jgi:hypothetical protein